MERQKLIVLLDDDTEHEITVANPSLVAFDRTRALRDWPTMTDAPMVWATFVSWHQLKAQKVVTCTHSEFEERVCQGIEFVDTEEADADPTQPTAEPDSSSD